MNTKPKILIVDDHKENLVALERTLGNMDAELVQATSGNEALALTLEQEFALAIMDVQMPGMDGYEAVALMRQQSSTQNLPVIFLSAIYSSDYYKIKGVEVGAVDFITKPFPPEVLTGKVRIFLNLYRQQRALELEIMARKKSEQELEAHRDHLTEMVNDATREIREREQELEAIYDHAPIILLLVNQHGIVTKANCTGHSMAQQQMNGTVDLQPGKVLHCLNAITHPEGCGHTEACQACVIQKTIRHTLKSGKSTQGIEATIPINPEENVSASVFLLSTSLLTLQGEPYVLAALLNITDRKKAELALRDEKERAQQYLNVAGVMLLAINPDGIVTMINEKGAEILESSVAEIIGKNWFDDYVAQECRQELETASTTLLQGDTNTNEYHEISVRTQSGGTRLIACHCVPLHDVQGNIIGYLSSGEDITEKRKLEEHLQLSQRMESIGTLAGGVAHDFNNLLMGIDGYTYLLREEKTGKNAPEYLEEISKCVKSAARLTRQLLAFARRDPIVPKTLDLNQTINQMLKLLQRLIGEDIELSWTPEPTLRAVKLDPGQIDQILTNLCVNARDAIGGIGKISITTYNKTITTENQVTPEMPPGHYVVIAVSDTGCGMNNELQEHIFEPFYTSKEVGKGTGLGLSTVYGIVKQNNGHISLQSEPEKGSTFHISLPSCEKMENVSSTKQTESAPPERGKILLVEDNHEVRKITKAYLIRMGHIVLDTPFPDEAIKIAEAHPDIDLLLSDVVMPEMGGRELAEVISVQLHGIKILFMSGYTDDIVANHGVLNDGVHLLNKPFTREQLEQKLKEVLNT